MLDRYLFAQLYREMRDVAISCGEIREPVVRRDCGPQLLVLLLEQLTPESFLHMISECEDLRMDLLWCFFSQTPPPSLTAEPFSWVEPHPSITQDGRGSPAYNAAMRHKLMSVAMFVLNCARVGPRYDVDKITFSSYRSSWQDGRWESTDTPAMMYAIQHMLSQRPREFMLHLTGASVWPEDPNMSSIVGQCTDQMLCTLLLGMARSVSGPGAALLKDILQVSSVPGHWSQLAMKSGPSGETICGI